MCFLYMSLTDSINVSFHDNKEDTQLVAGNKLDMFAFMNWECSFGFICLTQLLKKKLVYNITIYATVL